MIKLVPILFGIFRRAKVLQGALSSKTTKDQWLAVALASVAVASIQYFMPIESGLAEAAVLVAASAAAPLLTRLMRYKEELTIVPADAAATQLIFVKSPDAESWKPYSSTVQQAYIDGFAEGTDAEGNVWNLETFALTRTRRLPKPNSNIEVVTKDT